MTFLMLLQGFQGGKSGARLRASSLAYTPLPLRLAGLPQPL